MGAIAGRVVAPRRRFRIVDGVYHGWQVYHPEEAVSDHRSRVSLFAWLKSRRVITPRRRFRIVVYGGRK